MNKFEFYHRLKQHDWFYYFSDRFRVSQAGENNEAFLKSKASELGPEFVEMFKDFVKYRYEKVSKGNNDAPYPKAPEGYEEFLKELELKKEPSPF